MRIIPTIEEDPVRPIRLSDVFIRNSVYGMVMDMNATWDDTRLLLNAKQVCIHCKYYWGLHCNIDREVYGRCGELIGSWQYYR
jgi:hypothetical protein